MGAKLVAADSKWDTEKGKSLVSMAWSSTQANNSSIETLVANLNFLISSSTDPFVSSLQFKVWRTGTCGSNEYRIGCRAVYELPWGIFVSFF